MPETCVETESRTLGSVGSREKAEGGGLYRAWWVCAGMACGLAGGSERVLGGGRLEVDCSDSANVAFVGG